MPKEEARNDCYLSYGSGGKKSRRFLIPIICRLLNSILNLSHFLYEYVFLLILKKTTCAASTEGQYEHH